MSTCSGGCSLPVLIKIVSEPRSETIFFIWLFYLTLTKAKVNVKSDVRAGRLIFNRNTIAAVQTSSKYQSDE